MSPQEKIKNYFNKTDKGVKFQRNKKYYSILKENTTGRWIDENPLFVNKTQGLYPVFKTGGPQGKFTKNHQEFILKNLPETTEDLNI